MLDRRKFWDVRRGVRTKDNKEITGQMIAGKAGLTYEDVYTLDVGGHISRVKVKKILNAFNDLSGLHVVSGNIVFHKMENRR